MTYYHTEITVRYIYMVMELCNYEDLEKYYIKHAPLNTSDMNIILKQLASGLQLLYSNKIIHRDLRDDVSKVRTFWGCRGTRQIEYVL